MNIAERLDRKYRDILLSSKDVNSPTNSIAKKKFDDKTDGVLSIIKSCEFLRDSYRAS